MKKSPPCPLIQIFFIGVDKPLFVLTLHERDEDAPKIKRYAVETVRLLSWCLLDFCRLDFIVLPCTLTHDKFQSVSCLKEETEAEMAETELYYRGPDVLDADSFENMKAAATALAGTSIVPCLLENPKAEKVSRTCKQCKSPIRTIIL